MKARHLLLALGLAGLLGCGVIGGNDDDDDDEADEHDPALVEPTPVPPPETNPEPVADAPATPSPGTFTIPGLEGFPIPLPAPQTNREPRQPPARGSLTLATPGTYDQNGYMTHAFLESRAIEIHRALVVALDQHQNQQILDIPFEVVSQTNEPNAAAACTADRRALMMITSAMLELAAGIAETTAYDELANTTTYEDYVGSVVQQVRNSQPVEGVSAGVHGAPHALDPHKLSRQQQLFEQQVAFIVGHELAHHYLGHTSCVGGRTDAEIQRDEMSRILAHTVPPFSQPREVEADMWGATNVMEAGRTRTGLEWTEEGALLNLDFFRRLTDRGGQELLLAFLSTHPPSIVRIPIVQSVVQQWTPGWRPPRMPIPGEPGNGQGIELPTPGGPIRLPDPATLPFPFPLRLPQNNNNNNGTQTGNNR